MTRITPRPLTIVATFGLSFLLVGSHDIILLMARDLRDPAIAVWTDGTLTTFLREIFIETDFVGPDATAVAWLGLATLGVTIAVAAGRRLTDADPNAEGTQEEVAR